MYEMVTKREKEKSLCVYACCVGKNKLVINPRFAISYGLD